MKFYYPATRSPKRWLQVDIFYLMHQDIVTEYLPFVFLAIGLCAVAFSIFYTTIANSDLKKTGIPVDGIVFKQEIDDSFQRRALFRESIFIMDKITVRFVTLKQEWITGPIKQDFNYFYTWQYKDGQTIKVFYDEKNPSNFYVGTGQSELIGRVSVAITGLIIAISALFNIIG